MNKLCVERILETYKRPRKGENRFGWHNKTFSERRIEKRIFDSFLFILQTRENQKKMKKKTSSSTETKDYKYTAHVKDDHDKPIYSVKFCDYGDPFEKYFATAGHNQVRVYKCQENSQTIESVQAYVDSDESECFYAVEWLIPDFENNGDQPLVIAGGSSGVIKVINCAEERMTRTLMGHSDAVNDVMVQAYHTRSHLLLSIER